MPVGGSLPLPVQTAAATYTTQAATPGQLAGQSYFAAIPTSAMAAQQPHGVPPTPFTALVNGGGVWNPAAAAAAQQVPMSAQPLPPAPPAVTGPMAPAGSPTLGAAALPAETQRMIESLKKERCVGVVEQRGGPAFRSVGLTLWPPTTPPCVHSDELRTDVERLSDQLLDNTSEARVTERGLRKNLQEAKQEVAHKLMLASPASSK